MEPLAAVDDEADQPAAKKLKLSYAAKPVTNEIVVEVVANTKPTRNRKMSKKALESGLYIGNSGGTARNLLVTSTAALDNEKGKKSNVKAKPGSPVEVSCCLNCEVTGVNVTFCESGRFCSQSCAKEYKKSNKAAKNVDSSKVKKWSFKTKTGNSVEVCSCLNCGVSGVPSSFFDSGRFCSQFCTKEFQKIKLKMDDGKGARNVSETLIVNAEAQCSMQSLLPKAADKPLVPNILPALSSAQNVTKLTISNGEVIAGNTKPTTEPMKSTPQVLMSPTDKQTIILHPTVLENHPTQMILLKPIASAPIGTSTIASSPNTSNVMSMLSDVTPTNSSQMPQALLVPVVHPTNMAANAPRQQIISTPSGQQFQITLKPANKMNETQKLISPKMVPDVTIKLKENDNPVLLNTPTTSMAFTSSPFSFATSTSMPVTPDKNQTITIIQSPTNIPGKLPINVLQTTINTPMVTPLAAPAQNSNVRIIKIGPDASQVPVVSTVTGLDSSALTTDVGLSAAICDNGAVSANAVRNMHVVSMDTSVDAATLTTATATTDAVKSAVVSAEICDGSEAQFNEATADIQHVHVVSMDTSPDTTTLTTVTASTDAVKSAVVSTEKVGDKVVEDQDECSLVSGLDWTQDTTSLHETSLKLTDNEFGNVSILKKKKTNGQASSGVFKIGKETKAADGPSEKDDLCCCSFCGCYGLKSEFCKSGRFCSMSCVGANANRRRLLKDFLPKIKPKPGLSPAGKAATNIKSSPSTSKAKQIRTASAEHEHFNWDKYLEETGSKAVPTSLFDKPFPESQNKFEVGMKMEAIDPNHQSLFCVVTVVRIVGYRLLLHFDGYPDIYEFWVNANSKYIFPPGYCQRINRRLMPPTYEDTLQDFSWDEYLSQPNNKAAPEELFAHVDYDAIDKKTCGFEIGQHLEAIDKRNYMMCVVSIKDIIGDQFLLKFDGWDDFYDYWVDATSPFIHPVGWSKQNGVELTPPKDYDSAEPFDWDKYLAEKGSVAAPADLFNPKIQVKFEVGDKLEVVDVRNPSVVRVATVANMKDHFITIHFDGWSEQYDFLIEENSIDIHPVGWCEKTGHLLLQPPGPLEMSAMFCKMPGCSGHGNIKNFRTDMHNTIAACPYSRKNYSKEVTPLDRITARYEKITDISETIKSTESLIAESQKLLGIQQVTQKKFSSLKAKTEAAGEASTKKKRGRKKKRFDDYITDDFKPEGPTENGTRISPVITPEPEHNKHPDQLLNNVHISVFCPVVSVDPDKEFKKRWVKNTKHIFNLDQFKNSDVTCWTVADVVNFVKSLPLKSGIADLFNDQEIDGLALSMMSQMDFVKDLNMKLGPALILYNSVAMITDKS